MIFPISCTWPVPIFVLAAAVFFPACGGGGGGRVEREPTPLPTATLPPTDVPFILVQSTTGQPGETVAFNVNLRTANMMIVRVEHDLRFDALDGIRALRGAPDCTLNADLGKTASAFTFQPAGCAPGSTCQRVRVVIAGGMLPIPDNALLYTCRVALDPRLVSRRAPLECAAQTAVAPDGQPVTVRCSSGEVNVRPEIRPTATPRPTATLALPTPSPSPCDCTPTPSATSSASRSSTPTPTLTPPRTGSPNAAIVAVPSVRGMVGQITRVDVRLIQGNSTAQTANEIVFPPGGRFAARADGKPDCAVNVAIRKDDSTFMFLPEGCTGDECAAVRAVILSAENTDRIPVNAILYTCQLEVIEGSGLQPLVCRNPSASAPDGSEVSAECRSGQVIVGT